jgi:recombination protein RecR
VLLGRLSPLEGVGPDALTVGRLLERVDDASSNAGGEAVSEVVLALNPTLEGDGTALYLSEALGKRGVRVTRLARGLPAGRELEFASKAVLAEAIQGRLPME